MNRIYLICCLFLFPIFLIAQTDSIPPNINCPPADTVTLGSGGDCSFQYFYAIVSSDNEPGDTLVQLAGLESGAGFPLGNTVNIFQAIDAAGNTASCSFVLTVQNYAGPLVCKTNLTVSLDSTCAWTAKASDLLDGNVGCTDSAYYVIEVDKTAPSGNGPWEPAGFGPDDVGKTYIFRVLDTIFGYNCTGDIQIMDLLPPVLTCQNITISCAVDNVAPYFLSDSLGFSAAQPVATDACGQVLLTHIDSSVDSGCTSGYVGAINRTWTAQDDFGNTSTCMQQILLTRPVISDLQYPPDITLDCANPDLSASKTGLPYLEYLGRKWINTCSLGTAFNDTTIQLCPGISQVVRTWFVIDWCNGDALEKVQTITLNDTAGPAFLNCPANVTVSAATSNCVANIDLPDFVIADACSYATEINAYWVIDSIPGLLAGTLSDYPGNDTTYSDTLAVFGVVPGIPPGIHVIRYTATDACGGTSTCEFNLHVWDSIPPTPVCPVFKTVSLTGDGTASLGAETFDDGSTDDCGLLAFKINRLDTSPCAPDTVFDDTTEFCCLEAGDTVIVVLRVYDVPVLAGPVSPDLAVSQSADCLIKVWVQDPDSVCGGVDSIALSGKINTENGVPVANVNVKLEINPPLPGPVFNTQTDINGVFSFNAPLFASDDYILTPAKNTHHLDGVSTFDLVLISKHILGIESLDSPYKMVAADANHSGSITTFDIVEIRKLILGIYTALPNNTSWRFIPKDFIFPDPANPWLSQFPESITRTDSLTGPIEDDFFGIKTGDVNGTAIGDPIVTPVDDRTDLSPLGGGGGRTLFFNIRNREVEAGDEFTVRFTAAEKVLGYQFTLNTDGLEVLDILPGNGMSAGNFAVFPNAVTTSVDVPATSVAAPGEFAIKFRAAKAGQLSDLLSVSSLITRAEAYKVITSNYLLNISLRFDDGILAQPGFELYQNRPNPVESNTAIVFRLPENAEATLSILDETGRILHTQSGFYKYGYNEITLEKAALDRIGVLFYKLETATDCAVRKMVIMK